MLRILTILLISFTCFAARAQEPSLTATVSSTRVLQNSVFEIQFELKNAVGEDFQPPEFRNFKIVGGPSLGSSTMIINGRMSRSQSWSYSLLATEAGRFTIEPAYVIAGRKRLSSKPLTIDVLAAEDMPGSDAKQGSHAIKLVASIKPGDYYPGQQVVLEYKLLFTENIESVTTVSEDDYSDFFVQNFNSFSRETNYESIGGVTFASRIIKAVALFPHQSGTFTIDPMVILAGIQAPYPANQGFFSMRRVMNVQIASEPLVLHIKPLPPQPSGATYTGAVGTYEVRTVSAGSTQITTDDDFFIRLQFRGNGDARRWDPPVPVTSGDFEMYEPRIIDDNVMDAYGEVMHSRTVEYTMIPRDTGSFNVYVPFQYFDPAIREYRTIYSDTFQLDVSRGRLGRRSVAGDTTSQRILPLREVRNVTTDDRFWRSIPHLALFGLLAAGVCWGAFVSYKRRTYSELPESERKRSQAYRNARQELDVLERSITETSDRSIFEKVAEIYYKFLSEKFNIPYADLDTESVRHQFENSNIPFDESEQAIAFYDECLTVRYGGVPAGYTQEEIIAQCRKIIGLLESAVHTHI